MIHIDIPSPPTSGYRSRLSTDGSALICFKYKSCRTKCARKGNTSCGKHQPGKAIAYFQSLKYAIKDGSLLSSHEIQIVHCAPADITWARSTCTPSNRTGLFNVASVQEMKRLPMITKKTRHMIDREDLNHQPFSTIIFQYDMKTDRLFVQKYVSPPLPYDVYSLYRIEFADCWKDVAICQINWSWKYRWLLWIRAEQDEEDPDGIWFGTTDVFKNADIFWNDDMYTLAWKKNAVMVLWYDKFAYVKARDKTRNRHWEKSQEKKKKKKVDDSSAVESISERLDNTDLS